ncbi:MAG: hypothetical protein KGL95_02315, partial [Patescibacteria group bacterium]|nr:hypothetical protein [Patescibacteria group bacterium]
MPKIAVEDRTKLSLELAKEIMKLTMIVGEAFPRAMRKQGIEISRINYQNMGNRVPIFHMHIFGRVRGSKTQKYGEALYLPKKETGFYDAFKPLTGKDTVLI